ncbi:MAG: hypothetical protein HOI41_11985 [Acidimicrobiaceae bacterium]|nr:hypothetical protein [Acidimicrobiaceae bacterium]
MHGLPVPDRTEDFTADPVELFFDLAFVYAFSQLVAHLVHFPTWGGAGDAALVFLVLWFAWSTFTWAANAVSGNAREVRFVFLVGTAVSVPMGASVQTAFSSGGGTFAICASVIVGLAIALQLWATASLGDGRKERLIVIRYGLPNLLACSLLIAGGFHHDPYSIGGRDHHHRSRYRSDPAPPQRRGAHGVPHHVRGRHHVVLWRRGPRCLYLISSGRDRTACHHCFDRRSHPCWQLPRRGHAAFHRLWVDPGGLDRRTSTYRKHAAGYFRTHTYPRTFEEVARRVALAGDRSSTT